MLCEDVDVMGDKSVRCNRAAKYYIRWNAKINIHLCHKHGKEVVENWGPDTILAPIDPKLRVMA